MTRSALTGLSTVLILGSLSVLPAAHGAKRVVLPPRLQEFPNASGSEATYATGARVEPSHPFFQSLGTNGRSCGSCHDPAAGWTLTPALAQARFATTNGLDPLFRLHDGANSPLADVSTPEARAAAYSMLLTRGVIRIELPVPADGEFEVTAVDDPYGYANAERLSLFRRPLPATNLKFHIQVMWDGRNTQPTGDLVAGLRAQAQGAHTGHAQGTPLGDEALQSLVDFELGLFSAQIKDSLAGAVDRGGVRGGPRPLVKQKFYPGINNPFELDPKRKKFNPNVFQLFKKWQRYPAIHKKPQLAARGNVGRGEKLFNTFPINIFGVRGLNDVRGQTVIQGTCATCHNVPNVGTFSLDQTMNIGTELLFPRQPDQPLYTLRNKNTLEVTQTTDPGRALITGKWEDVGKFKTPSLRGLASRAPYFHDGSAETLEEVVDFYVRRFGVAMNQQQVRDIAAFLRAL